MAKVALISGGSGMVGRVLTEQLIQDQWEVRWLSTRSNASAPQGVSVFSWSPDAFEIDPLALENVDTIFHLAGANVAARWTDSHKKNIYNSRIDGTQTLLRAVEQCKRKPHTIVSASAVGYYPSKGDDLLMEDHGPGSGFLSEVVIDWEKEVQKFSELGVREVRLRIGIVLDKSGGVLGQLLPVFKWGIGSQLGDGKQWMPWIHVSDLARMFHHAATNEKIHGPYNAGGPAPVTNAEFSKTLAKSMDKPYFFPTVPAMALKLVLGEMAQVALMSTRISTDKMAQTGFEWDFQSLEGALDDLLG